MRNNTPRTLRHCHQCLHEWFGLITTKTVACPNCYSRWWESSETEKDRTNTCDKCGKQWIRRRLTLKNPATIRCPHCSRVQGAPPNRKQQHGPWSRVRKQTGEAFVTTTISIPGPLRNQIDEYCIEVVTTRTAFLLKLAEDFFKFRQTPPVVVAESFLDVRRRSDEEEIAWELYRSKHLL